MKKFNLLSKKVSFKIWIYLIQPSNCPSEMSATLMDMALMLAFVAGSWTGASLHVAVSMVTVVLTWFYEDNRGWQGGDMRSDVHLPVTFLVLLDKRRSGICITSIRAMQFWPDKSPYMWTWENLLKLSCFQYFFWWITEQKMSSAKVFTSEKMIKHQTKFKVLKAFRISDKNLSQGLLSCSDHFYILSI